MQILGTLDTRAPKGTAVTALYSRGEPENGTKEDKQLIREHIQPDSIYHVDYTLKVTEWRTEVYLIEVPGIAFNSVNFKEVK